MGCSVLLRARGSDLSVPSQFLRAAAGWWVCCDDGEYVPRVLVTDKLASYPTARRRVLRSVEHRRSTYLNNRGRELASTDPGAGASDEEVHLSRACTTVSVRVQRDLTALPAPPPPAVRRRIPARDGHPIHHLERGHGHGYGSRLSTAPQIDPTAQPRFHMSIDSPKLDKSIRPSGGDLPRIRTVSLKSHPRAQPCLLRPKCLISSVCRMTVHRATSARRMKRHFPSCPC